MALTMDDLGKERESSLADGYLYRFGQFALDARKRTLTLLDEETQTTLHDVPLSANVVVEFHVIPQRPAGLRPGTRVTPPHRVPGTFDELKPGMRLFFMTLRFVDGQATIRHLVVDRVEEVKDTKP